MNLEVRTEDGGTFHVDATNAFAPALNVDIRLEDGTTRLYTPNLPAANPVRVEDGSIQVVNPGP